MFFPVLLRVALGLRLKEHLKSLGDAMRLLPRTFAAVSAAVLFIAAPFLASAQPLTDEERGRVEAVLEGLVEEGDPGFAVGIVRGGEPVFEAYDGLADLSHAVPIDAETRFNIASVAKQYVGLMVLDLAEQGRIDVDADFRTYLPDAMPDVEATITVTNLLTHTSGVRDIYELYALTGVTWYERPIDNGDVMALLDRQTALNFEPGSQYLYSNSNYILLTELIGAIAGEDFDDYARGFFDRIGMPASGWKGRYGDVLPNAAKAYNRWNGWLENPSIANTFGDGFLFTTLRDQMAWEAQAQGAESTLSATLIEQSQARPDTALPGNYGFGLEQGSAFGAPSVFHVGSTGGFNAYTLRLPTSDTAIVVMVNSSEVGVINLGNRMAAALADRPVEEIGGNPAGPDEVLARPANAAVLGTYELDSGTIVEIAVQGGQLVRKIEGRDPVALNHEEGNVFAYQTIPGLKIAFDATEEGTRRFRLFMPSQGMQTALQITPPSGDEARKRSLERCFVNAETDTWIQMVWEGDLAFRMIKNGRSRDATMVGEDYIRWNSYRLRFERDQMGAVERLWVDNSRIKNVRFELSDACA